MRMPAEERKEFSESVQSMMDELNGLLDSAKEQNTPIDQNQFNEILMRHLGDWERFPTWKEHIANQTIPEVALDA